MNKVESDRWGRFGILSFAAFALLTWQLLLAPRASAQSFTLSCPEYTRLVGIRGRESNYFVESLQGICSRFDSAGQRIGGLSFTSSAGGTPTQNYQKECPAGMAVTQLFGVHTTGMVVASLRLKCERVNRYGEPSDPPDRVNTASVGGSGLPGYAYMNTDYAVKCSGDSFARTISGGENSSAIVRLEKLTCDPAPVVARRADVSVPDVEAGVAAVVGEVQLDGYALNNLSVSVRGTAHHGSVGGSFNLPPVTVVRDEEDAVFAFAPHPGFAGCIAWSGSSPVLPVASRIAYQPTLVSRQTGAPPFTFDAEHLMPLGPESYSQSVALTGEPAALRALEVSSSNPSVVAASRSPSNPNAITLTVQGIGCAVIRLRWPGGELLHTTWAFGIGG